MIIFDENKQPLYEIDNFRSLVWAKEYFGCGEFKFYAEKYYSGAKYFYNSHTQELGIITGIRQQNFEYLYTGKMLKHILNSEVIETSITFTNKTAEQIAKELVAKYFPTLKVEPIKGLGTAIEALQVCGENLMEYTDDILKQQELGAYVDYNFLTGELTYIVYEGTDNTNALPPFSEDFENVVEVEFNFDETEHKNFAYVYDTYGDTELTLSVDLSGNEEKKKIYLKASISEKDMSLDEFKAALVQYGTEKLTSLNAEKTIYFTPLEKVSLGEKRLFKNRNIQSEQRVTQLIYGYEDGQIKQTVTFGLQKLTSYEKVKKEVVI